MGVRWIDLVAPDAHELAEALPDGVDPAVVDALSDGQRPTVTRPTLEPHGSYLYGLVAAPVVGRVPVAYEEIGFVTTRDLLVTVRRPDRLQDETWHRRILALQQRASDSGHGVHLLLDEIAADMVGVSDDLFERIDEAEDLANIGGDDVPALLSGIRHDVIHARRHVSSLRNAIRRIVDGRTDLGDEALFPTELERLFTVTSDGLQRTAEELDIARELLAGLRDHHQANVMEAQNEVVKKLTVIASLVLVPSLVTGFFGQNFAGAFDDGFWDMWVAIALIVGTTILQLVVFRWRRWI